MDGRTGNRRPERKMALFLRELLARRTRHWDEPDTLSTARSLRRAVLAENRARALGWFGRPKTC